MNHSDQQDHFRLIACPHVFSVEKGRIDVLRPPGGTVTDLMRSIGWTPDQLPARVFIDGEYIKNAAWEYTVTHPGQSVVVRAIPMGGGEGKDVGRMVAMIAIIAVAFATQQHWAANLAGLIGTSISTAAAIGTTTVSLVASLAFSGLIPQPLPRRALPQPAREWDLKEVA